MTGPDRPPRPRDAATLVLGRRRRGGAVELLMGLRGGAHAFLPEAWVFPGGRVERGDSRAPAAAEPDPSTLALLAQGSRRAPRAFPLAAARETLEETGLRLGEAHGPPLDQFRYLARAVTPKGFARRFDARFFVADAEATLRSFRREPHDDEFAAVRWVPMEEARNLAIVGVTRAVLTLLEERETGIPAPAGLRLVATAAGWRRREP